MRCMLDGCGVYADICKAYGVRMRGLCLLCVGYMLGICDVACCVYVECM